jgi:hypothetical protein
MCPVCLATMGLYLAGGISAGGITTYLTARVLRERRHQHESITPTDTLEDRRKSDDEARHRDT